MVHYITKHFRYLKWTYWRTGSYKAIFGYFLVGFPLDKPYRSDDLSALHRFCTSILGTWNSWWLKFFVWVFDHSFKIKGLILYAQEYLENVKYKYVSVCMWVIGILVHKLMENEYKLVFLHKLWNILTISKMIMLQTHRFLFLLDTSQSSHHPP